MHTRHRYEVGIVVDRFLNRLEDRHTPLADALTALFRDLVATHDADPALSRALAKETPHPDGPSSHKGDAMMARIESALRSRREVKVRSYAVAAHLLAQATGALSRYLVHDAPEDLDVEMFIDDSVAMLSGYALRGK